MNDAVGPAHCANCSATLWPLLRQLRPGQSRVAVARALPARVGRGPVPRRLDLLAYVADVGDTISIVYFVLAAIFGAPASKVMGPTGRELQVADCGAMAARPGWLLRLVPDLEASCVRALSNDRRALNEAMQNVGGKDGISQAFEFLVYTWSVIYLFLAARRVYRASTFKVVLGLLALAASYTIFWALGVAVAGTYAFLRA